MAKSNTNDPILVLVRRGRNGRGFSVSPVEDASNAALCADDKEIGEVIVEMLDDPNQPRVDVNELFAASAPRGATQEVADYEDEDEEEDDYEDEEEDGASSILSGEGDIGDRLLLMGLTSILDKGRKMSSSKVRAPSAGKKKKKKKKKAR